MNPTGACEDCVFWDPSRENEWTGFCRRYAPSRPTPAARTGASVHFTDLWPVTARGSWCGEFQRQYKPGDRPPDVPDHTGAWPYRAPT